MSAPAARRLDAAGNDLADVEHCIDQALRNDQAREPGRLYADDVDGSERDRQAFPVSIGQASDLIIERLVRDHATRPDDAVRRLSDEAAWAAPAGLPTLRRHHGVLALVFAGLVVFWTLVVAGLLALP